MAPDAKKKKSPMIPKIRAQQAVTTKAKELITEHLTVAFQRGCLCKAEIALEKKDALPAPHPKKKS